MLSLYGILCYHLQVWFQSINIFTFYQLTEVKMTDLEREPRKSTGKDAAGLQD